MSCKSWVLSRSEKIKDALLKRIYWVYVFKFLAKISLFLSTMGEERWFKALFPARKVFIDVWVEDQVNYVITLPYGVR